MNRQYQAGAYRVFALRTGEFAMDGGAVFGVVPKVFWQNQVACDHQNRVEMAVRSLLIIGENRKILVDTGIGEKIDDKRKNIYRISLEKHNLSEGLAESAVTPEEISDVILTHLHFDHCGGAVTRTGDALQPAFPRAKYHVSQRAWDWAKQPLPVDKSSFIQENYESLERNCCLDFVRDCEEIAPGIRILEVNGHTPGLAMVYLDDPVEPLLFCSDLFPTALHVPVTWISAFDLNTLEVVAEKQRFLEKAAKHNWRLFFPHDAAIVSACVEKGDRHFRIRNIDQEN